MAWNLKKKTKWNNQKYKLNLFTDRLVSKVPLPLDNKYSTREAILARRGEGIPIIMAESQRLSEKQPVCKLFEDELPLMVFPVCSQV